jgi:hypothetical protein
MQNVIHNMQRQLPKQERQEKKTISDHDPTNFLDLDVDLNFAMD